MRQYEEAAYYGDYPVAAEAADTERASFLRSTYAHLAGALVALILIEVILFQTGLVQTIFAPILGAQWGWIGMLVAFMIVSGIASRWAASDVSKTTQYIGLGVYTLAEALILAPLLWVAQSIDPSGAVIGTAAIITLAIFGGLTGFVMVTGKDFSFIGGALSILAFGAIGLFICSMIFSFSLGLIFTVGMVVLMAGFILYHTSQVLHHYPVDKHVAASLALFSSIATLFWYVLQLVIALSGDE